MRAHTHSVCLSVCGMQVCGRRRFSFAHLTMEASARATTTPCEATRRHPGTLHIALSSLPLFPHTKLKSPCGAGREGPKLWASSAGAFCPLLSTAKRTRESYTSRISIRQSAILQASRTAQTTKFSSARFGRSVHLSSLLCTLVAGVRVAAVDADCNWCAYAQTATTYGHSLPPAPRLARTTSGCQ